MIRPDPFQLSPVIRQSRSIRADCGSGPDRIGETFRPSTCSKCQTAVLTGIAGGFRTDLEPYVLNDHTEVDALTDNVPTYNLFTDRQACRRWLEHIKASTTTPRHAQHTCGRQYGRDPMAATGHRLAIPDEPQF